MNTDNIAVGKPKVTGAIWRGPLGTALPTDATTTLNAAYKNLGYASQAGLENQQTKTTGNVKAWGGASVLAYTEESRDRFKFKLIEANNEEVLKAVHNSGNVTGTLSTGVTVKVKAEDGEYATWVFEIIQGKAAKRIVVPKANIVEIGAISYVDNDSIGYEVTIEAVPDASGVTHYEYIKGTT